MKFSMIDDLFDSRSRVLLGTEVIFDLGHVKSQSIIDDRSFYVYSFHRSSLYQSEKETLLILICKTIRNQIHNAKLDTPRMLLRHGRNCLHLSLHWLFFTDIVYHGEGSCEANEISRHFHS